MKDQKLTKGKWIESGKKGESEGSEIRNGDGSRSEKEGGNRVKNVSDVEEGGDGEGNYGHVRPLTRIYTKNKKVGKVHVSNRLDPSSSSSSFLLFRNPISNDHPLFVRRMQTRNTWKLVQVLTFFFWRKVYFFMPLLSTHLFNFHWMDTFEVWDFLWSLSNL